MDDKPAALDELLLGPRAQGNSSHPRRLSSSSDTSALQMQRPHDLYSSSSGTPPSGAQHPEAYRAPATGQNAPSSMSQQQHQQQPRLPSMSHQYSPMNGATMQAPPPPANAYAQPQYPYQNSVMQPAPIQNGITRFPIPPQVPLDSRAMSSGRNKKEIKRRTKTGCLTCRKRRIKCDEAQPACRNCAKSKRECLGYDPIFKSQSGPAPIQPAPASAGSDSAKPGPPSSIPSNPYQSSPPFPGTGSSFAHAASADTPYEYGASLDPALASGDPSLAMAQANPHLQPERKPKLISMDDLFALNDIRPQYVKREVPPPLSPATQQEIAHFYNFHYAPGLDRLLETDWYSRFGLEQLQQDAHLQDYVAQCIDQFKARTDEAHATNIIKSLEARLVWQLATMCRRSPSDQDLGARVETLENLLTGHFLDPSRVPPPPPPSTSEGQREQPPEKYNEQAFWHHLGHFVTIRDDRADTAAMRDVQNTLASLRGILNMLENRDVLYSIAIARHVGGRVPEFHPHRHLVASTNDPNDEMNKLKVAQHFVETEDQRGTTQVIQRVCGMALRSWALQKQ